MLKKVVALFCLSVSFCFGNLTLEEKVGQLLMVHFHGEDVNDEAKTLIQETKVGGIIYYNWANGLTSPSQVQKLSQGLQKLAEIPLLIAADQEGGLVARLTSGFTVFPGSRSLAATGDLALAEKAAFAMGEELRAVGVNMNLAPVVDVNINPKNPVIGIRSFGDEPQVVTRFGEQMLKGFKRAGVLSTLKHFPGHGDVEIDSHEDLPVVNKSLEQLERIEFFPFKKLAPLADAVMTAHLIVPSLDPDHCSTLSSKTLSYLRHHLGFEGVIMSDSLVMEGVLKKCQTVDEAAIQALKAGCDILILGGKALIGSRANFELTVADVQRIHASLVTAVKSGRIPESRVNDALHRVLKLKERLSKGSSAISCVNSQAHQELARKVATSSLKVTKKATPSHVKFAPQGKVGIFAPLLLKESLAQTSMSSMASTFYGLAVADEEMNAAEKFASTCDAFLIFSYNAWKNPSQEKLIKSLLGKGKSVFLVVVRDSLDEALFPQAEVVVQTFSPSAPSLQAAWDCWVSK